jgi:hypothetical protein
MIQVDENRPGPPSAVDDPPHGAHDPQATLDHSEEPTGSRAGTFDTTSLEQCIRADLWP